jgi:hypothetical protein
MVEPTGSTRVFQQKGINKKVGILSSKNGPSAKLPLPVETATG